MVRPAVLTLSLALLGACASKPPYVPPVTPEATGVHHDGKFVWYDLITDDVEAVKRFYGELFGWEFEAVGPEDDPYIEVYHHGKPIAGIVYMEPVEQEHDVSQWVSWMSVADVDLAVGHAKQAGGEVHRSPRNLPPRGRYAIVSDPQGALFAVVRSEAGDPPDTREVIEYGWLWTELWTRDKDAAIQFYQGLAGFETEATDGGVNRPYTVLMRDDRARAGVGELDPASEFRPNWLPYVQVEDPVAVVARVEGLGGLVWMAPDPEVRGATVGVIQDPAGAVLAIQKWPLDDEEWGEDR